MSPNLVVAAGLRLGTDQAAIRILTWQPWVAANYHQVLASAYPLGCWDEGINMDKSLVSTENLADKNWEKTTAESWELQWEVYRSERKKDSGGLKGLQTMVKMPPKTSKNSQAKMPPESTSTSVWLSFLVKLPRGRVDISISWWWESSWNQERASLSTTTRTYPIKQGLTKSGKHRSKFGSNCVRASSRHHVSSQTVSCPATAG